MLREALKTAESGPDEDGDRDIAVGEVRQARKGRTEQRWSGSTGALEVSWKLGPEGG